MRSRLLLTTALASSVWFPVHAADFSTPLPHLALPAVDGFNGKVDAFFGANRYRTFLGRENEGAGGVAGSISIPLSHSFGFQVDALVGGRDGGIAGGGAAHLFWRQPDKGLFGLYGSLFRHDRQDLTRARLGLEGELYHGRFSLVGLAGYERTDASAGFAGVIPGFNVFNTGSESRFFSAANINFYASENWKLSVGHRFTSGIHVGAIGTEYLFQSGGGTAFSVFAEGRLGENRYSAVWGGVRVYFGAKDKPLIRRHREDDPTNWLHEELYGPRGVGQRLTPIIGPPPPPPPPPPCSCGPCYPT